MGPFAFLITLLVDYVLYWVERLIDLKRELSKFVGWAFENSWPFVSSFIEIIANRAVIIIPYE